MKKTIQSITLTLLFSYIFCHPTAFAMNKESENEIMMKIWALEEAYITYHRDADHDKVIPLWHEQFLGWPNSETLPTDKNGVIRYLERNFQTPGTWSFSIERVGIRITGNIAITHYNLVVNGMKTRVTHTWINENSKWKILGGMSAKR